MYWGRVVEDHTAENLPKATVVALQATGTNPGPKLWIDGAQTLNYKRSDGCPSWGGKVWKQQKEKKRKKSVGSTDAVDVVLEPTSTGPTMVIGW